MNPAVLLAFGAAAVLVARLLLGPGLNAAAWIAAGRRDVPHDRFRSAVELWFGGLPEAETLFAHIEDARYDTVVMRGVQLRGEPTPLGGFQSRLPAAIRSRHAVDGPLSIEGWPGAIVFRKEPGRD